MSSSILRVAVLAGAMAFAPAGSVQTGSAQTARASAAPAQPTPAQPVLHGFPFTSESLAYSVEWPSGLSLGEGHLSATIEPSGWRFELTIDAGVPGFAVKDTYGSTAGADLCSASLSKDAVHGSRKSNETVTIDRKTATATRHSNYGGPVGGTSKLAVPDCVRDALTFLFYTRRELGQGRVPVPQQIIFGALYNASLQYAGAETILVNNKRILTDKIACHIKGPASDVQFDAYFDRDPARTPVSIRVPLPVGKLSLELVR